MNGQTKAPSAWSRLKFFPVIEAVTAGGRLAQVLRELSKKKQRTIAAATAIACSSSPRL